MERTIRQCDNPGCTKQEEKGNHWYKIARLSGIVVISRVDAIPVWEGFSGVEWKDACGRKCATEMFAAWMGEDDPT